MDQNAMPYSVDNHSILKPLPKQITKILQADQPTNPSKQKRMETELLQLNSPSDYRQHPAKQTQKGIKKKPQPCLRRVITHHQRLDPQRSCSIQRHYTQSLRTTYCHPTLAEHANNRTKLAEFPQPLGQQQRRVPPKTLG